MAYLFNSANDDPEENGKTNIFGGDSTGQPPNSDGNSDVSSNGGSQPAPSGGGGGSTTNARPASQNGASAYNPKAASSAFQSLAQKASQPRAVYKAQGAIVSGNELLQKKANAYKEKIAAKASEFDIDEETINTAAHGGSQAKEKVGKILGKSNAEPVEKFEGLGKDSPNVDYMKDPGHLYVDEVPLSYTNGQSRFDNAILRRNPEFIQNQDQIFTDKKKLDDLDRSMQESETANAQLQLNEALKTSNAKTTAKLQAIKDKIKKDAEDKDKTDDEKTPPPSNSFQSTLERIRYNIRNDLRGTPEDRALQFLDEGNFDISPYISENEGGDWHDYISDYDANEYNNISELLGSSDRLDPGKGPRERYSVDEKAIYKAMLAKIRGQRQETDAKDQAEIARIQSEAAARAQALNQQYAGNATDKAKHELELFLQELNDGYQGSSRGQYVNATRDALNELFGSAEGQSMIHDMDGNLDWRSVLSPEQASQLSGLASDAGLLDQYSPGTAQGQSEYDLEALKNLYKQLVQKRYSTVQGAV